MSYLNPTIHFNPLPVSLARFAQTIRQGHINPEDPTPADPLATLGEMLGRHRRRRRRPMTAQRRRRIQKFKTLPPAKKRAVLTAMVKTASPAKKKRLLTMAALRKWKLRRGAAKLKRAIAKSPRLKKQIIRHVLQVKVNAAKAAAEVSPNAANAVPQGEYPSPPPQAEPAQPAVEEGHEPTPQESVETMQEEGALETAQQAEEENAEAVEEAEQEVVDEGEEQEIEEEESLTEPTEEEAAEDAEEEVEADTTEGWPGRGGSIAGMMGAAARKKARIKRVHATAKPLAKHIEKKSKGKIPAATTMKGCALIQAAKAGNPKAKAVIRDLEIKASDINRNKPGHAKAKKTLAHLKLCGKVVKKARKVVRKASGKNLTVYNRPVRVVAKGLASYSAHQRGLAMIPAFARTQFRSVR